MDDWKRGNVTWQRLLRLALLIVVLWALGQRFVAAGAVAAVMEDSMLVPLSGIVAVAAGNTSACALTNSGGVKCWGGNEWGQLGDGTRIYSSLPVDVVGLRSGAQGVSAGLGHVCALTIAGSVKCWGLNDNGQIGDGSTEYWVLTPVDVDGLQSGVQAVSAGYGHTCALTTTGGVKCWGENGYGQAGDGSTEYERRTPVDVVDLDSGVQAIAAGGMHTCALTTTGGVKCWGANQYGQLGDGTRSNRAVPVDVAGLENGVQSIAAGADLTCALTTAGGVKCWGLNNDGRLGDGGGGETCAGLTFSSTCRLTPVDVAGLTTGVQAIAASAAALVPDEEEHTCAVTSTGGVKCWGTNYYGQLGDGTRTGRATPVDVSGLQSGVQNLSAGGRLTCALTTLGGVKCWGDNARGGLGDGTTWNQLSPEPVVGLQSGVQAMSAGVSHTCALTGEGEVQCWGSNSGDMWDGQLGDGATDAHSLPAPVIGLPDGVQAIAASAGHTCALTGSGGVMCWGFNAYGEVGDGTTAIRLAPVAVTGLSNGVKAIAAGGDHTCALTSGGGVKCWGDNTDGQLGDGGGGETCGFLGYEVCRFNAVEVTGLQSGVQAIAAGGSHTCALTTSGGIKCWGNNDSGRLGDGTTTQRPSPVDVFGLQSGVQAIAAGGMHTCALTTAGGVKCWGYNVLGALGDGTTSESPTPVDVAGLQSGVQAIVAGGSHTCAITVDGGMKCWGSNQYGQAGDGSTAQFRATPVDVAGLQSGVQAIAAGGSHTCAITTDGGAQCWGIDNWGQLATRPLWVPVDVLISAGEPDLVTLRGTATFVPGSIEPYVARVYNATTARIDDAVLRVLLPAGAEYVDSTAGGMHWWAQREIFWRLGDLVPGQEELVSLRVVYDWGMPAGTEDSLVAQVSGSNLADTPFDVAPYLAYTPPVQTAMVELSQETVQTLRGANPKLDALFGEAISRGYEFAYASRHTFDGEPELTKIVLLRFHPQFGVVWLWLQNGNAAKVESDGAAVSLESDEGAMQYDPWTGIWSDANTQVLSTAETRGRLGCMGNCVWEKLPDLAISRVSGIVGTVQTALDCKKAAYGDRDAALNCAKIVGVVGTAVDVAVDLGIELGRCNYDCKQCQGSCSQAECHCCKSDRVYCEDKDWLWGKLGVSVINRQDCDVTTGRYSWLPKTIETCGWRGRCVTGPTGPKCRLCPLPPLPRYTASLSLSQAGDPTTLLCQTCVTAKDPNELFGPSGDLLPGQLVTYTITYENEGAGAAYGVFIVDVLSEHFDLATLTMAASLDYSLVGRAVFWSIGDLAPKGQSGSTGAITFSVRLKQGLPSGTIITNQAVVHFPSVPEETPTNPAVNLVRPLAAIPQTLQVQAGQPVAVTLQGLDAGSAPLVYRVTAEPRHGELAGTPPVLTYTPDAQFAGDDRLMFEVDNGTMASSAAAVTFQVDPSPDDATPPTVLWSAPAGDTVVTLSTRQAISGTAGLFYPPGLSVTFSEPLDPATVNAATVFVAAGGPALPATVTYVAPLQQAYLYLQTPWASENEYTLTVTQEIKDLNGNALATPYNANFTVTGGDYEYFIPMIAR